MTIALSTPLKAFFHRFIQILRQNGRVIAAYDTGIKGVFLLWLGLMIACLLILPYHYDEAYSYYWFTSKGWGRIMTFFPLPNNHIFYNLVAFPFTLLPLDPVITTRLPSLFAAVVALFYFVKLCRVLFGERLSLFLGFLLASSYPFILYGVEGRGYGFLICFAVLQLYAADRLSVEYRSLRYRILYLLAFGAGMYTMYSYLYFALPLHILLWVYVSRQKAGPVFWKDSVLVTAIVAVLYWIIANHNGIDVLIRPNGSVRLTYDNLFPVMGEHFRNTWSWLTNSGISIFAVLLLAVAPLADRTIYKGKHSLPGLAVGVLLLSPPILLLIKPVIFFVRTWTYLIVPVVLGLGFLLHGIARMITRVPGYRPVGGAAVFFPLLLIALILLQFFSFRNTHRKAFAIDYAIEALYKDLGPALTNVHTVFYTRHSMEYYLAEQLQYKRAREHPDRPLAVSADGAYAGQDMLILASLTDEKEMPSLINYRLAGSFPGAFALYVRKDLH